MKVEIEAKSTSICRVSQDYHNAKENSTPSAYKSSVKLPFGASTGF